MTRLVNDMRDTIVERLIKHTFNDEIAALHKRQALLAYDIYRDVFSRTDRDYMAKIPEGWLPTDDDIFIKVEGDGDDEITHRFRFDGNFHSHQRNLWNIVDRNATVINERFPQCKLGALVKVYAHSSKIGTEARTVLTTAYDLHQRIEDAKRSATATLYTFYTTEKLITAWPEIEPFVPAAPAPAPPPQPVALPTAQLNTLFKLPVPA